MNSINIYNFIKSCEVLDTEIENYLRIQNKNFKTKIKIQEIQCLQSLINNFDEDKKYDLFDKFYFGYTIPQINKEFDLLRFGEEYIINIELKSIKIEDKKIIKQLNTNRYYLNVFEKKIYSFTYCMKNNTFYKIENEKLITSSKEEVCNLLIHQKLKYIENINKLFDPKKFLISPFNTPEKFYAGKYFLTQNQDEQKKNINEKNNFIIIEGKPGVGKSLFLYDLFMEKSKANTNICMIHCGNLNEGHEVLKGKGLKIIDVKSSINYINTKNPRYIFIDEIQRIRIDQLNIILNYFINNKCKLFVSIDPKQVLSKMEEDNHIYESIKEFIKLNSESINLNEIKFTEKIRTNDEIAGFIKRMFNLNKKNNDTYEHIKISHVSNVSDARNLLSYLKKNDYNFINFTSSIYYRTKFDDFDDRYNSHKVIGQEFDKVVVIMGEEFFYNTEKKLSYKSVSGVPYSLTKMLYEAVTRVKSDLYLIILNNPKLFKTYLKILYNSEC